MLERIGLAKEIATIEPLLDDVMRFHPASHKLHEGLRLREPVCGFASNVLGKYLKEKNLAEAKMMIGRPVDEFPTGYPRASRTHVVLDTRDRTIDSSFGQFMSLVGLDVQFAALYPEVAKLYPQNRVAVIPRGDERAFGERFADFALDQIPIIQRVRRGLGEAAKAWSTAGACIWMPGQEAFELLADIWNPEQYGPFDNEGDSEIQAQEAARYLMSEANRLKS
jgi:hypothetical protein